nr:hypothetical protein [Tanacetum cinerariifolium]
MSSAVTYTSVYTDSKPGRVFWGANEELSDGGPSRVIVYRYNGLPMLLVAPPSPDYQSSKSHRHHQHHRTRMSISLCSYRYTISISCQSLYTLRYVAESDLEEDLEEYEDDEIEDGLVDYPMDGGDDGDDDDGDSSGYDADDEDEDEEDKEEEEGHLAPADSAVVIPTDELVSPPEGTRLPYPFHQRQRCMVPAASPSPPLPPFLYPPPPVDCRGGIPESKQPPRKRLCLSTLGSRYEVEESSTRGQGVDYGFTDTIEAEMRHRAIRGVGYGIRDTWIDPAEAVAEMGPTTLGKVSTRVTELAELYEHDTHDLYALLEDAQDSRNHISQRVAIDSQRVDLLMGDRMTLQETVWIMEEEAYAAREAWAHSIGLSQIVHHELQTLREQVYAQE